MPRYYSVSVKDKWTKTKWLLKDPHLRKHVPETKKYSKGNLKHFVKRYQTVYFKPTTGTGGKGITKITRLGNQTYQIKSNSFRKVARSLDSLHKKLKKLSNGKSYLLQRGISLKHHKNRPFDLRVMVQKSYKDGWVPTAIFSKIGKKGKVATNYHQGGKLALLDETLRGAGYSEAEMGKARRKLKQMGIYTGKCFDRHRKGFRELGLDVAIDRKGRYWILEVNTRPQIYPLRHLKNKKPYHRIMKYAKEYGREK